MKLNWEVNKLLIFYLWNDEGDHEFNIYIKPKMGISYVYFIGGGNKQNIVLQRTLILL